MARLELVWLLSAVFLAIATAALCDLSGSWVVGAAEYEFFTITSTNSAGSFVATCEPSEGLCNGWRIADLSVAGDGTVSVRFDSGMNDLGAPTTDCSAIFFRQGGYVFSVLFDRSFGHVSVC